MPYTSRMSENINDNSMWTDTHGIAKHFDMKANTLRKQRVKQSPTTLKLLSLTSNIYLLKNLKKSLLYFFKYFDGLL